MSALFRVAVESHDPEQVYITTMYFATDDGASPGDLVDGFDDSIQTKVAATLVTIGQLDRVTAVEVPAVAGSGGDEATRALTKQGGYADGSGHFIPRVMCGVIDLKSDFAGRGAHGWRWGRPARRVDALDGGGEIWAAGGTYQAQLAVLATAFSAHIISNGFDFKPVVYSRTRHQRGDSNYWFDVTAAVPRPDVRYLRTRDYGH